MHKNTKMPPNAGVDTALHSYLILFARFVFLMSRTNTCYSNALQYFPYPHILAESVLG